MKKPKYLVFPGTIISKSDGEFHTLSAGNLISLYGVDPRECVVIRDRKDLLGINRENYIELHPLYKGNYKEFMELISKYDDEE